MKFIVYAPGDYTPNGGGCVALHKLAHNIALLGEHSYIMTSAKNPNYLGIQVDESQAAELAKEDAIVIYPEVIIGNPLNAKHVMRWILYYVRQYGDYGLFGADDLIYKYAPIYTLRQEQPVHGELRAMELNLDLFIDRGEERDGSCFLYKKQGHKANIHPADSIFIDSYRDRGGNEYLADIFNYCERFYAYDDATWISIMAALCGCESIVVPDNGMTAEQWHNGFPYFKYGIAYGLDDLEYAKSTAYLVKEHLLSLEKESLELTAQFIADSYSKLGLIKIKSCGPVGSLEGKPAEFTMTDDLGNVKIF